MNGLQWFIVAVGGFVTVSFVVMWWPQKPRRFVEVVPPSHVRLGTAVVVRNEVGPGFQPPEMNAQVSECLGDVDTSQPASPATTAGDSCPRCGYNPVRRT